MFVPLNRRILVEPVSEEREESFVLVPETAKVQPAHSLVRVVGVAFDCEKFNGEVGSTLVVDASMIEEINVGKKVYNVILENHVIGLVYEEKTEE